MEAESHRKRVAAVEAELQEVEREEEALIAQIDLNREEVGENWARLFATYPVRD